jgi:hypothetical protein
MVQGMISHNFDFAGDIYSQRLKDSHTVGQNDEDVAVEVDIGLVLEGELEMEDQKYWLFQGAFPARQGSAPYLSTYCEREK